MKPVSLTPAMCLAGLLSGCVPAGGGPGGGGGFGASSAGPQSPQLEGWEIQELLADGSALIYWSGDGYADCIYFYPNGRFESDGYWVEYGEDFYFDGTYSGSWYVQGNQVCIDAACYYAEWRNGEMWLLNGQGSYEASFPVLEGPGYLYNNGCDIVF